LTPTDLPAPTIIPTATPVPIPVLKPVARYGKGDIGQIAWSPDGKILAVASSLGIYLLDAVTLAETRLMETDAPVETVAISPDSRMVASGGRGYSIRLWDLESGLPVKEFHGDTYGTRRVLFGLNGKSLIAWGYAQVLVWEITSGQQTQSFVSEYFVSGVDLSPDARTLALARYAGVEIRDIGTGELLRTLSIGDNDVARDVAFLPDGKTLAVGLRGVVQYWDVGSGRLQRTEPEPNCCMFAFSADGLHHAMGSEGWGHGIELDYFFDELVVYERGVKSFVFSPDGNRLASSGDNKLQVWDTKTRELLGEINSNDQRISQAVFDASGNLLTLRDLDGSKVLWDADHEQALMRLDDDSFPTSQLMLIAGDNRIALGVENGSSYAAQIWNLDDRLLEYELPLEGRANAVAFSPDGKLLATAESFGSLVKLWNVSTGKLVHTLSGHHDGVWALSFSTDGKLLASSGGAHEGLTRVWAVETGGLIQKFSGAGPVFLPDSYSVMVVIPSGENYRVWVVDAITGKKLSEPPADCVAFVPNATTCVTSSTVMDFTTGQTIYAFQGLTTGISYASFTTDGTKLVTTSHDGTVRVWELP
jgi:WD40 repeat protein